jgi:hypothetical protein
MPSVFVRIFIPIFLSLAMIACGTRDPLSWDKRTQAPLGKIERYDSDFRWVSTLLHAVNGYEYGRVTEFTVFEFKNNRIVIFNWKANDNQTIAYHVDNDGDYRSIPIQSIFLNNGICKIEKVRFQFVTNGKIGPELN